MTAQQNVVKVVSAIFITFTVLLIISGPSICNGFKPLLSKLQMSRRCPFLVLKAAADNGDNRGIINSLTPTPGSSSSMGDALGGAGASRGAKAQGQFIAAEGSGSPCRIKVIGVGGGGGNAVNRMIESSTGILGVELWTVNTDSQALSRSLAPNQLNIGRTTSR